MKQYLYIGTYTEPILFGTGEVFQGKGKGVSICEFEDGQIKELKQIAVRNPSFVCADEDNQKLYAVNEMKEYQGAFGGGITQISYNESGDMAIEADYNTAGTDPCHIIVSPDKTFVAVSNFASGSLTAFMLGNEGNLTGEKQLFQHTGSSVHPVRQRGPHAHSAIFAPDGKHVYIPDLGLDMVKAYIYENGTITADPEADITVEAGSGPRFGEFSADGKHFYLINEIGSKVMHFCYENGKMIPKDTMYTLPEDFTENNICSDLHLTPNGEYLYASNRGHDSVICCKVEADGSLTLLSRQPCGGKTPRNFVIDPTGKYVLIGNQDSDTITVFEIGENGMLTQKSQCNWGSPVCLRFFQKAVF